MRRVAADVAATEQEKVGIAAAPIGKARARNIQGGVDQLIWGPSRVDRAQAERIGWFELRTARRVRVFPPDQECTAQPVAIELMQGIGIDAEERPETEQHQRPTGRDERKPQPKIDLR